MEIIKQHLAEIAKVLDKFTKDEFALKAIETSAKIITSTIKEGGKVISCGNGGSMCDAMHFAEEMTGRFRNDRKALPAIAISDPSYISCVANDYGFEKVFSRFIEALGNKGDVLLAISTSGNSSNIIEAIMAAKLKNMYIIGLTGNNGGELANLCDTLIRVPASTYADRIQEIHIKVIHILIDLVERGLVLNS